MPRVTEGDFRVEGKRFVLIASRFNKTVVDHLIEGALDALRRHGVPEENIELVWVPGAFELPLAAREVARRGGVDAIVALAAIIRGATPHFDHVASACASGIQRVALEEGVPIAFGVLTTETLEQAFERAGTKAGNRGFDAAMAAMEMASLLERLGKTFGS